jgi:hypothetical protein
MTACALACWASFAAAQVNPGDPSSSALGPSPGASGAVSFGGAPAGAQAVIPVGPGPSYPSAPRGITHLTPDLQVLYPGLAPVDASLLFDVRLKLDF